MTTQESATANRFGAVHALIPYAHVADVEQSLAFYTLFGFAQRTTYTGADGRLVWADATSGAARLMLARASGPIAADQQAVLFYMYSNDVAALRRRLLESGLHDGGDFSGRPAPSNGRPVVFDVVFPHYMPEGEIRVHDPDGYVLLIGQMP